MGFYFAWLVHYTSWLMIPSAVGLLLYSVQIIVFLSEDAVDVTAFLDDTDSAINVLYSIFVALWTTFLVESWKRKQNFLANRWLVRDFVETSFDRKTFKASLDVDPDT